MSIHSQLTSLYFWYSQPVLQGVVAAVMWRRKLHKQFPVFYWFLLAQIAIFAVTYPLYRYSAYKWYFWTFWTGEAITAVLGFKVIHEIFLDIFRPYHSLRDLGTPVFKWAGVVMLLVSVVVAASNTFAQDPIIHAVATLQRSVRMVQVGLILFLVLFSRFLGVSRKQYSFGISLGFGVFAGTELMLLALREGGIIQLGNFNLIYMPIYDLSILVWLTYSVLPIVGRSANVNHLQTQRWEKGLSDLQHATPANDSLIPMFEGMVERAFSKSSNLQSTNEPLRVAKPTTAVRTQAAAAVVSTGRR
ncbi:MAG TPA: hypothetical protein VL983_02165 [Terriglobales bacterium]|nr:hypothetical protein [Terriglobales bacterium]